MTMGIILAAVVALVLYGIKIYNSLVKNRQLVEEGWSGIDVQLKRRTDLIPNLLASVKGYMSHEKDVLTEVTELRTRAQSAAKGDPAERGPIEAALSGALGRLLAVAESYPDLKASQNFLEFQTALKDIEEQIQLSRRYYNGSARNMNVLVESVPSNFVANWFKFVKAEYFELDDPSEKQVPKVSFD